MEITKKVLTEEGILLHLDSPNYTVTAVYVASQCDQCDCVSCVKADKKAVDFEQDGYKLTVHAPSTTPTLSFITVKYMAKGSYSVEQITIPFLNEFSLFKAKTKYLDIYFGCDDCCHDCHDHCLGKCCGVTCCQGNCGHAHYHCQKGHDCCNYNIDHNIIGCGYNSGYCKGCEDKNRTLTLLTFMLRMNIFQQCYKSNNLCATLKAYKDLCRIVDLDKIPFNYVNLESAYYKNPGRLHELFVTMNEEIKRNSSVCTANALKMLMVQDLYSLLFTAAEGDGNPEWILEDTVWNMDNEFWFNDKNWKY